MFNKIKWLLKDILTGFKILISKFFYYQDRAVFKPANLSLMVEDTCFFRCKQCSIWKLKTNKNRMNLSQMKLVVKKLHDWLGECSITFAGGEPFLNKDLIELISYTSSLGIATNLNTNAYLVNEQLAGKIVKSGLENIRISIDGIGARHDRSRGIPGAFNKAEKAIKSLISQGRKRRSFTVGLSTVIMKTNLDQLEKIVLWGDKLGVDEMSFQVLWEDFAAGKHDQDWFKKSKLWPEKNKAEKAIDQLVTLKKQGYKINTTWAELEQYREYFKYGPKRFGNHHRCMVGLTNFSVGIDGEVRLCYSFSSVGNVLTQDPEKIWQGVLARKQRRQIRLCKRGCKVLLCNRKLGLKSLWEKFLFRLS